MNNIKVMNGFQKAVVQRCSVKKVFLKVSQNSQENNCVRVSFLIELQAGPATLLKKRHWHRCFPVNFAKFLRTPLFIKQLWSLLLVFLQMTLRPEEKYFLFYLEFNLDGQNEVFIVVEYLS